MVKQVFSANTTLFGAGKGIFPTKNCYKRWLVIMRMIPRNVL